MNLVGSRIGSPVVKAVWTKLNRVFSHSDAAHGIWAGLAKHRPPTSSNVRWWSQHEALATLYDNIEHLIPCLESFVKRSSKSKAAQALLDLLRREPGTSCTAVDALETAVLACAETDDALDDDDAQLDEQFACLVESFLTTQTALSASLSGLDEFRLLLAAQLDVGDIFATATYQLERNGFMAPFVRRVLDWVESRIKGFEERTPDAWRRTRPLVEELFATHGSPAVAIMDLAATVQPAFEYFENAILNGGRYATILEVFDAARLLDPHYVSHLTLRDFVAATEGLISLPFVDDEWRRRLVSEAAQYHWKAGRHYKNFSTQQLQSVLERASKSRAAREQRLPLMVGCEDEFTTKLLDAAFEDVPRFAEPLRAGCDVKAWSWWEASDEDAWRRLAARLAVFTPSSAAAERAFSLFKHSFNSHRYSALPCLKEACVLVRYNTRQRTAEGRGMVWRRFIDQRY